MLTPHMRYLYNQGLKVDLMCRKEVKTSHLLDECPYVDKLITVDNPWNAPDYVEAVKELYEQFIKRGQKYAWKGIAPHMIESAVHKIDITSFELKLEVKDKNLEVFIAEDAENFFVSQSSEFLEYVHVHTMIENHPIHSWDATDWIKENLPDMPIVDTGFGGKWHKYHENINHTFLVAKHATHRVYSSSVMVHAAEAMGLEMDIINYGKKDRKVWPLNQGLVKHIREEGRFIK